MIINNEHKLCRAFSRLLKTRNTFKLCTLYTARVNDACQPDHLCSSGESNSIPTAPKASALPLTYRPLQNFLVLDIGCSSVILLRPKMGVAPHKHEVISMSTQQCTHTKHISIERYHPVVSVMLRYLDQIKTFGENLCCRKVKIDRFLGGDLPLFALKCDNFPKGLRKAECPNEAYFLAKKI